jgi:copper chaperone CopZ
MRALFLNRHRAVFPLACVLAFALLIGAGCSSKSGGSEGTKSGLMKVTFSVPEMDCTSCALKSKNALEQFDGVDKAYANFLEKRAWARYDPKLVKVERMKHALEALGFKEVTVVSDEPYVPEPLPTDL